MTQNGGGQSGLEQLPYYREYVDQILKPRVGRIIEEVRSALTERVWADVLERMAQDQGLSGDAKSLEQMRVMLEQSLKLRMSAHVVVDFAGGPNAPAQANGHAAGNGSAVSDSRDNVDVVDPAFPNNPLARAVGGIRRVSR